MNHPPPLSHKSHLNHVQATKVKRLRVDPLHGDFTAMSPTMQARTLRQMAERLEQNPRNEHVYQAYRQLLDSQSDAAEGYNDLAIAMAQWHQPDRAEACFNRAITLEPNNPMYYVNLGRFFRENGRLTDAIATYREAIRLRPTYADAQWNLSLALLCNGQFDEGWQRFVWRRQANLATILPSQRSAAQSWKGTEFKGKRLLIRYEQGMGDSIQLVRFLPQVKALGGTVILETLPALRPVFEHLPGIDELVPAQPDGRPQVPYDYHAFIMDLPGIFNSDMQSIPRSIPYIYSPPKKRGEWLTRLQGPEFKVGIVWSGAPQHTNDANRSCPLACFYALLSIDNLMLFSLQKGLAATQINADDQYRIVDLAPYLHDFSDTAAVIDNLDLVISVDTAVLHLAGAMGKPTWGLLPFAPDWRWLENRKDSPWYPSLQLFRQTKPGQWQTVFEEVHQALQTEVTKA